MTKIAHLIAGMLMGGLLVVLASAVASKVSAQDPVKLAPGQYKVLLENEQVRVFEYRLKPGEKEPTHSHPFGVVVYFFSNAKLRTTLPDGRSVEDSRKAGEAIWREPVTHAGENIGNTELPALVIEPKNACK